MAALSTEIVLPRQPRAGARMTTSKAAVLPLILFCIWTSACSMDSKLVGEWQSNEPKSVRLTITRGPSANDGYHDGFSFTQDGVTYTAYWLIRNESGGTVLYLSPGGPLTGLVGGMYTGMMQAKAMPRKVIELTSDRLVVEWGDFRGGNLGVYEFHRVK